MAGSLDLCVMSLALALALDYVSLTPTLVILISGHYEYFASEEIVIIIYYSSYIISNSLCSVIDIR